MYGWTMIGLVVLVQELWWKPRSMAKVRERVVRRSDPGKFDAYLDSGRYRLFRWFGLGGGITMIVLGVIIISGIV